LTSIHFNEPSQLRGVNCIGNHFLSGTSIESLTLPRSIDSYLYISKNAFAGMDKLKEIHFDGISHDNIGSTYTDDSYGFAPGVVYSNSTIYDEYSKIGEFKKTTSYKYDEYFVNTSPQDGA
jgi:hypothetical protein